MQVLTQEDRARRLVVESNIDFLASLEEISWRQKSKALLSKKVITTHGSFIELPIPISKPIR